MVSKKGPSAGVVLHKFCCVNVQLVLIVSFIGHELKECDGSPPDPDAEPEEASEVNFIFVRLNVLRECLEKELVNHSLPFKWDLEVG